MKKGQFTFLCTLTFIVWAGLSFHGFDAAIPLLRQFFSGHALAIREDSRRTVADLLPIVAAIIPMDFVVTMLTTIAVSVLLGSAPEATEKRLDLAHFGARGYLPQTTGNLFGVLASINHYYYMLKLRVVSMVNRTNLSEVLPKAAPGHTSAFMGLMLIIIGEEVIARWLLVGFIPSILPVLNNTVSLYVLMIIGNTAWALLHIPNYKDGNPLRTATQFVPALMYNAVFLRFGLLGSLLLHFTFDCVIWAGDSEQKFNAVDVLMIVWSGFLAWLMWIQMEHPLTDILVWLRNPETLALPGWEFWDYLKMDLFIAAAGAFVFDLMLYDKPDIGTSTSSSGAKPNLNLSSSGPLGALIVLVIGAVLAIGGLFIAFGFSLAFVYGCFAVSGLFVKEIGYRIILASIFSLFLTSANSKSAVARSFFLGIPDLFVTIAVISILGWQAAFAYLVIMSAINLPRYILQAADS